MKSCSPSDNEIEQTNSEGVPRNAFLPQQENPDIDERHIMCIYPMWLKHSKEWLWGILLLPVCGIGLFFIAIAVIKRCSKKCIVTNKKVIIETGIFSKCHDIIHIQNIRSFRIEQTALERMFNCGTIILAIPGQSVLVEKIHNPHHFVDIINQYKT